MVLLYHYMLLELRGDKMQNILFINGCIREHNSRTLKIANTYIENLKNQKDFHLIERNLSNEDINFLSNKSFDLKTGEISSAKDFFAKEFADADEILLAAPFWEFLFPAIVSCYFEMVSIPGITFQYTEKGSVGLCNAKSLTYIYTSGDYLSQEDRICENYISRLSKLYGIPKFLTISAEGLDIETNCADTIVRDICNKIITNNK